jgi:hypothetical protein
MGDEEAGVAAAQFEERGCHRQAEAREQAGGPPGAWPRDRDAATKTLASCPRF